MAAHLTTNTPITALLERDAPRDGHRRRDEQRRLARQDRVTAHLAELHVIQALMAEARGVVDSGWVQHRWFAYRDEGGRQRTTAATDPRRMSDHLVTGACLVGAIVRAGGGPRAATTQPVQRALDLTWHVLYGGRHQQVDWCPAPPVRTAHVRDLTRWNDHPERTPDEVTALLRAVERTAVVELDRVGSSGPDSRASKPRGGVSLSVRLT